MYRARVKVCGITNAKDALQAIDLGADAIGLVFYDPSPRSVSISMAQQIVKQVPAFVSVVALFVDASKEFVSQALESFRIDLIQFHGNESVEFCDQFNRPYIKAIRVKDSESLRQIECFPNASGILLDAYQEGVPGGTGHRFDWSLIPNSIRNKIILAGGLTPQNVESAIQNIRPYAVDVSGGVEQSKGVKDHKKLEDFFKGVRNGERRFNDTNIN